MQHRKRKSTKKIKPQTETLPTEFTDVEFVKHLERTIKSRRPTKVCAVADGIDKEWVW